MRYTIGELSIIRRDYLSLGAKACSDGMAWRSEGAIIQQATKMGLLRRPPRPGWAEDRDVLVRAFADGGIDACLSALPNRTRNGIRYQLICMGLQPSPSRDGRGKAWTDSETEILREFYREGAKAVKHLLKRRTIKSIKARAHYLGLTKKLRHWTEEEEQTLRDIYPTGGAAAVREKLPHRTICVILARASRLGVRRRKEEA